MSQQFAFEFNLIILSILFCNNCAVVDQDSSPESVGGENPSTLSPLGFSPTKTHCVGA